jgi:hypothetical protein
LGNRPWRVESVLGRKLAIGLVISALPGLGTLAVSLHDLHALSLRMDRLVVEHTGALLQVNRIRRALDRERAAVSGFLVTGDERLVEKVISARAGRGEPVSRAASNPTGRCARSIVLTRSYPRRTRPSADGGAGDDDRPDERLESNLARQTARRRGARAVHGSRGGGGARGTDLRLRRERRTAWRRSRSRRRLGRGLAFCPRATGSPSLAGSWPYVDQVELEPGPRRVRRQDRARSPERSAATCRCSRAVDPGQDRAAR